MKTFLEAVSAVYLIICGIFLGAMTWFLIKELREDKKAVSVAG